jgi:mannan endo-1,4-beta-mannosidase
MRIVGAAAACLLLWAASWMARAQTYQTMAGQPDSRDFVSRIDTHLSLLGNPWRFGGNEIAWLGIRRDAGKPPRRPTEFEIRDALETVGALGGAVFRSRTLAATAGCVLCLEPTPGQFDAGAFATIDLVLKTARDLGLKVILPLAGHAADCSEAATEDDSICPFLRWRNLSDRTDFFRNERVRADFLTRVATILGHVNALTGVAYRNDPTILAWEDCDACGEGSDTALVSAWVEQVGLAVKAADPNHLYESGAFAGHIAPGSPHPVSAAAFATPSVDLIGDRLAPNPDPEAARTALGATASLVVKAGKAYVLDSFGWSPALWKASGDLDAFLDGMVRQHALAGAVVGGLQAHADQGGYLPAPPGPHLDGIAPLYFPGHTTADMDGAEMSTRGRALRRFNWAMAGVPLTPSYLLAPRPEIVSATNGHVVWRGAAGAAAYTIERSPDPAAPGSWDIVCDACVSDTSGFWQDKQKPAGPVWYRIMPFNINGHVSLPSDPFRAG